MKKKTNKRKGKSNYETEEKEKMIKNTNVDGKTMARKKNWRSAPTLAAEGGEGGEGHDNKERLCQLWTHLIMSITDISYP